MFFWLTLVLVIWNVYAKGNEKEYYNRGLDYYEKGMYDEAMIEFNKAIQVNPNYSDAYSGRGYVFSEMGKLEQTISEFSKAIQINPSLVLIYVRRGFCFGQKRDFDQAISDFSKAIQIGPDNSNVYGLRANSYCLKGDYENGLRDMNKAIALGDNVDPSVIDMIQKGLDRKREIAAMEREIKGYDDRKAQIQLEQRRLEIVGEYFLNLVAQQQQAYYNSIYNPAKTSIEMPDISRYQKKRYRVNYDFGGSGATIEEQ